MAVSELEIIRWLRERFRCDAQRVPVGIGDDAAVLRVGASLVAVTTDMLLDCVHFDTREQSYRIIGRKVIACSLSDCAAMGCRPRAATVSLALPQTIEMEHIRELYEGMDAMARTYGCDIVGGDTTAWKGGLAIDVVLLGEPMAERGPVLRSGAQPGDTVYVSGLLGGSILGRHLSFEPRLELAGRLVRQPGLHAMMDISDGLALDLWRLCEASNCDAELLSEKLEAVTSEAAGQLAARDGRSRLEHALADGEDYELLVAGGGELAAAIPELLPVGRIVPRQGGAAALTLVDAAGRREALRPMGYQHLTERSRDA